MPHRRLADLSTDHDFPVQRISLLALMHLGSAVLCLSGALLVEVTAARTVTLSVAAVVGLAVAGVLWHFRRQRIRPWVLQGALMAYSVALALVVWRSVTHDGVSGLGPAVIMVAAYAGCFSSGRTFAYQLAVALGGYSVAAVFAAPPVSLTTLLTVCSVALALGVVLRRLTGMLRDRSLFDSLTGAVSRATWLKIADGELQLLHPNRPMTVAMIDLDKFKEINDLLGHLAGDQLLRSVATAWTAALGRDGLLGRYGGDEFVVLFLDTEIDRAAAVLDRLADAYPVDWTVGLATAEPGDDLMSLLRHADLDLRAGKSRRPAA